MRFAYTVSLALKSLFLVIRMFSTFPYGWLGRVPFMWEMYFLVLGAQRRSQTIVLVRPVLKWHILEWPVRNYQRIVVEDVCSWRIWDRRQFPGSSQDHEWAQFFTYILVFICLTLMELAALFPSRVVLAQGLANPVCIVPVLLSVLQKRARLSLHVKWQGDGVKDETHCIPQWWSVFFSLENCALM